jgi:hypothetical protein
VIHIPGVVVIVSLQTLLRNKFLLILLFKVTSSCLLPKLVTIVVPTRVRSVLTPVPSTEPAELMTAPARHMHASFILLDSVLAPWTDFCVHKQPLIQLLVSTGVVFLVPFSYHFAGKWPVASFATAETPDVST